MFHIHKWSKWVAILVRNTYGETYHRQQRQCETCGFLQWKSIR